MMRSVAWLLFFVELTLAKRVKRVYNGLPVEGRNVYGVTQYNVWISNSHECDIDVSGTLLDWMDIKSLPTFRRGCKPRPQHLRGGGALISPAIIQTAGHVVADFNKNGEKYTLAPAIALHPSEQHFTVFLGWNDVSEFEFGVFSQAYYVHPRCGYLVGFNSERIVFDFGWIVLDGSVLSGQYENLIVNFAPVYTSQHLSDIWEASKVKQSTCLVMGWGLFSDRKLEASSVLLHGWVVHLSYWECYKRSDVFSPPQAKFKFVYARDASWDCALSIPHFNQSHAMGDSGSPVTCDNQFVGIVSWGARIAGLLGYHAPIAFSPFENSVEYRKAFVASLMANAYHPERFTNLPSPTPWTPAPERSYFGNRHFDETALSSSTADIVSEFLTLLVYCLVIPFPEFYFRCHF